MPQSYTSCHYHIVFSTKGRARMIKPNLRERLYPYLGGIVCEVDGQLLCIGGTEDHVHILFGLHPSRALADAVRTLKPCSSKWIHETFPEQQAFAWQPGYGAFSVSFSALSSVRRYIEHQEGHHRTMSFDEEIERLCARHEISVDVRSKA